MSNIRRIFLAFFSLFVLAFSASCAHQSIVELGATRRQVDAVCKDACATTHGLSPGQTVRVNGAVCHKGDDKVVFQVSGYDDNSLTIVCACVPQ